MTRYFLISDADGDSYVIWEKDGLPPTDRKFPKPIAIDRLPESFERWDRKARRFVRDEAAAIDEAHGSAAIARAHARKAIEADLILSGVAIPKGLLSAEAEATGQAIEELAAAVAAHTATEIAAEVERIVGKRAVQENDQQ